MNSHSSTQQFNTCPYAYKLHKLDGLARTAYGVESNDRQWGIAMHAGVKAYHAGCTPEVVLDQFTVLYPDDLNPEDKVWCREGGIRTLQAYMSHYDSVMDQWEVLATELDNRVEAESEVGEGHVVIDMVAKHRASGSIYFWDHKFEHKLNYGAQKQYELDAQLTRYTSYVQTKYGECAGAIINFICPGFRQRAYKGEPAGWHFRFELQIYNRSAEQVGQWRRVQEGWEWMIERCIESGVWPRHYGWQCPRCDFYDVCFAEREGADSTQVREAMYGGVQEDMNIEVEL